MDYCRLMISSEDIQKRVSELAREISRDYEGTCPLILTLLKGAFIFLADLVRHLTIPHEIDFVTVSSYRNGSCREPRVEIINHPRSGITDRHVLIVDEIIDTGHTIYEIMRILGADNAKSVKICTLLDKPDSREVTVPVHYIGFTIPPVFVVGYGLDFMERFRNLSHIMELPSEPDWIHYTQADPPAAAADAAERNRLVHADRSESLDFQPDIAIRGGSDS